MSEFINKPNKEELISNLELVSNMEYNCRKCFCK